LDTATEPTVTRVLWRASSGQGGTAGSPAARHSWRFRLMGGLLVEHVGRRWGSAQIGSRRARILLAVLAVDAGRLVPTDSLVETLWPGAAPKRPVANVATLVSRLRATLGTQIISGGRPGYRLGERVGTDLTAAAGLVASAEDRMSRGEYAAARTTADSALELMHDEVLPEFADETWAMPARDLRQRLLRRARQLSAEAGLRAGNPAAALAVAEAALAAEPFDEAACRLVMRAFYAMAQPALALRVYERLRVVLARDLGVDPAESTQHLYLTILRAGPVTEESGGPPRRRRDRGDGWHYPAIGRDLA
jgi:DNA-binding SARP family transcriptional activator